MINKIVHEIEAEQIIEIDTVKELREVDSNYMKRKYLTEVGLGVSLNHHTLVLANRLTEQEKIDPYQYHIYSIMCGDKVYFDDKETGIATENGLTGLKVVFFSFDENNNRRTYVMPFLLNISENEKDSLDYSKVGVQIIYPNELLKIYIDDADYIAQYGDDVKEMTIPAQDLFLANVRLFWREMTLKVLYVGQSYGVAGNRTAFNRLSSHSTYQKILSDLQERYPNKALYIYLMEINDSLLTTMDPRQETVKSDSEDTEHIKNVICNLPMESQVINIAEAAIINYFKPEYNKMYVENFPDVNHKGYKQYYDLDYNALTVEIYPQLDALPPIILFTETASLRSPWDFIEYTLHNDNNRKSMYDIFL